LDNIIKELKTDNTLTLLNILEIIKQIGSTKNGVVYLQQKGVFGTVTELLKKDDALVSTFVLELIGDLAQQGDDVVKLLSPEKVLDQLYTNLDSADLKTQVSDYSF
jgi:ABC-type transporter Mla maintaining outer membrane lipid asymmetry ATPase subunit MlaF